MSVKFRKGRGLVGFRRFLALCAALPLAACANSAGPVISTGDRYVWSQDLSETYVLGGGDKVRITVFNEPNLSGEYTVTSDGLLSLPLIGDIPAQDRTTGSVAGEFARRLSEGYLRDPKVSAEVVTYRPYFVLGEVNEPGQYPYVAGMTVMNAIATAKSFTPRARKKVVFVRARGEKAELEYELSAELRVRPGDTIRLAERYF
jgi:polysaccharide export outer membrane protein